MFYIIAYDITKDHVRRQVSKILSSYGTRVQKSVFELDLRPNQLSQVLNSLLSYIEETDSVRCYHLCERCLDKARLFNTTPLSRDQPYYLV